MFTGFVFIAVVFKTLPYFFVPGYLPHVRNICGKHLEILAIDPVFLDIVTYIFNSRGMVQRVFANDYFSKEFYNHCTNTSFICYK